MAKIKVRITLDAPPERVWADLAHLAGHVDWMHDAVAIRFIGDRTSGVGTRYECDTKVGPFRLLDVMEITEWQPGRAMGVSHQGLVRGKGRFTLRKARGGRTRFTWTERLRFPLWLGGPITAFAAKPVLRWVWKRNLKGLAQRHHLHSDAGPPVPRRRGSGRAVGVRRLRKVSPRG